MVAMSTTKLTSKGQVVIPEAIRDRLGLRAGCRFTVIGGDGVVVLRMIEPPSRNELTQLLAKARAEAKKAGIRPADIRDAIKRVRANK